jgi:hypothetical protein
MLKIYYNVQALTLRTIYHWVRIQFFLSRLHYFLSPKYTIDSKLGSKFVFLGNHRVRIFDRDKIYVLPKSEVERELISYEINLRKAYKSPKFISILDSNEEYFLEPFFSGTPLNRLPKKNRNYRKYLFDNLTEPMYMTVEGFLDLIKRSLARNRVIDDYSSEFLKFSQHYLDAFDVSRICVRLSHGDYQEGNILIDSTSKDWRLTDWEFIDYRCEGYDNWVLRTGIRNIAGLKKLQSTLKRLNMSAKSQMLMLLEEYRFTLENDFRSGYSEAVDKLTYLNDLQECLKVLR